MQTNFYIHNRFPKMKVAQKKIWMTHFLENFILSETFSLAWYTIQKLVSYK